MGNIKSGLFLVCGGGGRRLYIYADSGAQAKRRFCARLGVRQNDYWCGVSSCVAKRLSADEERAWLDKVAGAGDTWSFIGGMLDICVKAFGGA